MLTRDTPTYNILCRIKSRKELDEMNFNPNQLVGSENFPNPMLNALIACEDYNTAIDLINKYIDKLDPSQRDGEGKTALITAAKMCNGEQMAYALLECFKEKNNVNAQDEDGCSALHYAIAYRNLNLSRKLLEYGASSELLNFNNKTPLENFTLNEEEIINILSSIDITPDRDMKAKGNKLSWHFRFLLMNAEVTSDDKFHDLLNQTTTLENMNLFRNYVESDSCAIANKAVWLDEFLKPENSLSGKSVIQSITSMQHSLKDLYLGVDDMSIEKKHIEHSTGNLQQKEITMHFDHKVTKTEEQLKKNDIGNLQNTKPGKKIQ